MKKTTLQICLVFSLIFSIGLISAFGQDGAKTIKDEALDYNNRGANEINAKNFDSAVRLLNQAINLYRRYR